MLTIWVARVTEGVSFMILLMRRIFPKEVVRFILIHFYGIHLSSADEKHSKDISICKFKHGVRSAFCFSLDFEKPPPKQVNGTKVSFEVVPEILRIADYYGIPLTWATCGEIAVNNELSWKNAFGMIAASKVRHEIGSHTFHHKDISTCSFEEAEAEIAKGIQAFGENSPRSFVFPKNRIRHLAILERLGIIAYRGAEAKLAYPVKSCGLWNISQTYYVGRKTSRLKGYKLSLLLMMLVDIAIENEGVLHIWSHPWYMSIDGNARNFVRTILNPLFSYVWRKREKGLLWATTMRDLAAYCEAREHCTVVQFSKSEKEIRASVKCPLEDHRFGEQPQVTLKLEVPQAKSIEVLVDGEKMRQGENYQITKNQGHKFLLLMLSFDKPVKDTRILVN